MKSADESRQLSPDARAMPRPANALHWQLPAIVGAGLLAIAACTVRDDAATADSPSAVSADPTPGAGAETVTPDPAPIVVDTLRTVNPPSRNMPPVAGETAKQNTSDRRERDSAFDPMFELGPDGKARPIKR